MTVPAVIVVVPDWNGVAHWRACFDSRQDYPNFRAIAHRQRIHHGTQSRGS